MKLRTVLIVLSAVLHGVIDDQTDVLLQNLYIGLDLDGVGHVCGLLMLKGPEDDCEEEKGKSNE